MNLAGKITTGVSAAVIAGLVALAAVPAIAASMSAEPTSAPEATITQPEKDAPSASLDEAGVQAEYEAAVAAFPYPMPEGYSFPAEDGVTLPEANASWEAGEGQNQAWFAWAGATLDAAHRAHEAGDTAAATALLDTFEAAYRSDANPVVDPGHAFLDEIAKARSGDYAAALQVYPLR